MKQEAMPTMDINQKQSVEHAHKRIDMIEPRVKSVEEWQVGKDRNLEKIKNWVIGGVVIALVNAFGLIEIVKGFVL